MKRYIAAMALGSALLAIPASAQDGPRAQRFDPLVKVDTDKDGVVTKEEMLAGVAARFEKADANKDGKITADEAKRPDKGMRGRWAKRAERRMGPGMHGRMRGNADADGDGAVTLAEQQAVAIRRFDMVDANKDGKIDQAERTSVREKMMAMRGPGGPGGPGMRGMNADANGDGVITLEEQQALTKRRFDMIDTNKDGKIDQAERTAVREKMMAMRDKRGPGRHRMGPPPGAEMPPPPPADASDGN